MSAENVYFRRLRHEVIAWKAYISMKMVTRGGKHEQQWLLKPTEVTSGMNKGKACLQGKGKRTRMRNIIQEKRRKFMAQRQSPPEAGVRI